MVEGVNMFASSASGAEVDRSDASVGVCKSAIVDEFVCLLSCEVEGIERGGKGRTGRVST